MRQTGQRWWGVLLIGLVSIVFCCAAADTPGYPPLRLEFGPTPDWVENLDLDIEAKAAEAEKTNALQRNVLTDQQVRYTPISREEYQRLVYEIDNSDGQHPLYIQWSGAGPATVTIHTIEIRNAGAAAKRLMGKDIRFDFDGWTLYLYLPNLKTGDLVDVRFTVREKVKADLNAVIDHFSGPLSDKTGIYRFRLVYPNAHPVNVRNSLEIDVTEEAKQGGERIFHWQVDFDQPEWQAVDAESSNVWTMIMSATDWRSFSAQLYDQTNASVPPTLEFLKLVSELDQAYQTPREKLEAAVALMNRRLPLPSELHVSSRRWSPADLEMFVKFDLCQWGGCDAVFAAILDRLNIEYEIGLAASSMIAGPEYRMVFHLSNFGTWLFEIRLEGGSLWIESAGGFFYFHETNPLTGLSPRFKSYLPIKRGGSDLLVTENPSADDPLTKVEVHFDLRGDASGLWTLSEQYELHPKSNIRSYDVDRFERELRLRRSYPGLSLISENEVETEEGADTVELSFEFPPSWRVRGSDAPLEFWVENDPLFDLIEYQHELLLDGRRYLEAHPAYLIQKVSIDVPLGQGYGADSFTHKISNAAFEFAVMQTFDGQQVVRDYSFRTLKEQIGDENVDALIADLEKALELAAPWSISYRPN